MMVWVVSDALPKFTILWSAFDYSKSIFCLFGWFGLIWVLFAFVLLTMLTISMITFSFLVYMITFPSLVFSHLEFLPPIGEEALGGQVL